MPKLGLTMEQGTVVEWRCTEGQAVRRGEVVLLIESEKVEFEVEAPSDGVVRAIVVPNGETVPCGKVLAILTESAEEPFDLDAILAESAVEPEAPKPAAAADAASARHRRGARAPARASPRARRLAEKEGVSLAAVEGTGPEGRITEQDVRTALEGLGPRVSVGNARISYAESPGPEPPVAFLPGFGFDRTAFNRTVADLAGWRRLVATDPRGTGESTDPDGEPLRVERLAADVVTVLDALSVKEVDLVGSSLGAAVAVEVARASAERVRRLVLISPAAGPDPRLAAALDSFCRTAENGSGELLLRAMAPWLFGRAFLADTTNLGRVLGAAAGAVGRIAPPTLARHADALATWLEGAERAYAEVSVPTLVVVGTDDPLTPEANAEGIASRISGARVERLDGVGHAPMIEDPERLQALLRGFLGD
jgi:pyruvate dehydrogenase E2 component (dihydrolipoamide acetyltransferase)